MSRFHELEMTSIVGEPVKFADYRGRLCLIVNVASAWGLTPQYAGLRTMHESHEAAGLTVMGFPCNQFGAQEPGSNEEILEFARSKYSVTFPMFAKIEVNGPNAAPLFKLLRDAAPNADGSSEIQWNFTKFLVGRDGEVIKRYSPKTTPEEIEAELGQYL